MPLALLRYTEIFKSIAALLVVATATVAAPLLVTKAPPRSPVVGKCELMWVCGREFHFSGPAEFRADGTYTHTVDGRYVYSGTWLVKDGRLRVSERLAGDPDQVDWWVDLPTGVGETSSEERVEIWMKPS